MKRIGYPISERWLEKSSDAFSEDGKYKCIYISGELLNHEGQECPRETALQDPLPHLQGQSTNYISSQIDGISQ